MLQQEYKIDEQGKEILIQKYKPKSHTIVEMNPMVIKRLEEWAKDYDNIIIVEGTWQKRLDDLGKYDEIFFDDFPLKVPENDLEKKIQDERFYMFLDICLQSHTNPKAKFSLYLPNSEGGFRERMLQKKSMLEYEEYSMDINIPKNCNYHIDDKVIIPIVKMRDI